MTGFVLQGHVLAIRYFYCTIQFFPRKKISAPTLWFSTFFGSVPPPLPIIQVPYHHHQIKPSLIVFTEYYKVIIFQILYIIVGPLCPASLTKPLLLTSTVCSDWPTDTVHCDWPNTTSISRKCNAPFHNHELYRSK